MSGTTRKTFIQEFGLKRRKLVLKYKTTSKKVKKNNKNKLKKETNQNTSNKPLPNLKAYPD